jgi:hypothetical protein
VASCVKVAISLIENPKDMSECDARPGLATARKGSKLWYIAKEYGRSGVALTLRRVSTLQLFVDKRIEKMGRLHGVLPGKIWPRRLCKAPRPGSFEALFEGNFSAQSVAGPLSCCCFLPQAVN